MELKKIGLPYIDNAKAVLITVVVNLGAVLLFNWPGGITFGGVVWDSLLCAAITTAVDLWIVYPRMKRMRAGGAMPAEVPVRKFMQRLPQNPWALGVLYAAGFGVLTVGLNALILWFFGIREMAFWPWMVYKLIYATLLSIKITEYCIFRYVQPDWANTTGTEVSSVPARPVKNPLPKVSVFQEMFGSVTGNIALNILIGTALGGVVLGPDSSVVIRPTTVEGIPITGLIFGLITGILVTNGVAREINAIILSSGPAILEGATKDKRFSWMPLRRGSLMGLVCVCTMLFSAVALWAVMRLFGIAVMNFYQYVVFMTVYATLLSKPLSYVLIRRCMQPDYMRRQLSKVGLIP